MNAPRWPCCGRPSGSCRFWPPSNRILAFYPTLWQSSPCISPKQRTSRCHSCSAGLTCLAERALFWWGWLGGEQKCRKLEGVHWNKDYFKNYLAWKENLFDIYKIALGNFSSSAKVTSPDCKNKRAKRIVLPKF